MYGGICAYLAYAACNETFSPNPYRTLRRGVRVVWLPKANVCSRAPAPTERLFSGLTYACTKEPLWPVEKSVENEVESALVGAAPYGENAPFGWPTSK